MSSRHLIPVLCVGAVVFACGPRARNEAAPPKDSVALAQSKNLNAPHALAIQQGTAKSTNDKAKKPDVNADFYVRANGAEISFALHVQNNTKKNIELTFPSGQTHDFVVVDSVGREMWRWGNGRMFTQTLQNKFLGRGESIQLEAEMNVRKPLAPGRYIARAILTSANYPVVRLAEFTVNATTIAAR